MKTHRFILILPVLLALGLVTAGLAAAQMNTPALGSPPALGSSSAAGSPPAAPVPANSAGAASLTGRQASGQGAAPDYRPIPIPSNSAMMPGFLERNNPRSVSAPQMAWARTGAQGFLALPEGLAGAGVQALQPGGAAWRKPASPTAVGDWDGYGIYAPIVITDSGMLKMWYSGGDFYGTGRIGYAESADGILWTRSTANPVLDVGASGAWDDKEVGQPSVIKSGSLYQMWYFGADQNGVKQIGYATSSDGLSWTKHASNPVLTVGNPGAWDETEVGGPRVVFDGATYHLWYHGYSGSCCDSIGYATSPDGINWTKHAGNPVFGPGAPGQWDDSFIYFTSVLSDTSLFHMWYSVGPGNGIGTVTSTNGYTWTRFLSGPVLANGGPGEWDENYIFAPTAIHEDGLYRMWYTGYDANWKGRFGYATSADGATWIKSASNPVFEPGSYGLVMQANYAHDWVTARTTPNTPITVTVAGKDWIAGMTDGGGEFRSWDWNWNNNKPPDILPGDIITAVISGMTTEINPVGTIDGTLDMDADTIAGTINAPFGPMTLTVRCEVWAENGPAIELTGVPADGGSYSCDFGALGWDIQFGQQVAVMYFEPDADMVINVFEAPWMRVNYAHDWAGGNYPAGHTIWITVTDSTGGMKASTELVTSSGVGWGGGDGFDTKGDWLPQQPDIQEGDWVYFASDDGYSNALQVGVITGTVEVDNDSISGRVYAGWFTQTLNVECHPWGGPPNTPAKSSTAGPNGVPPYSCQWDPATEWDIQPGQDIAAMYIEPDGDRVINVFREPVLNIRTNYGHDWVEGNFEGGHTLWLTVTDSTGEIKATAAGETGPIPWWGGQPGFSTNYNLFWQGMQPDLQAGDWVYARLDNGLSAESHLGTIDSTADVDADTVAGTISAPWYTETLQGNCSIWEDMGPGFNFDFDPTGGAFECDFSGQWDIIPGHTIGVSYNEPDGDQVINIATNPAPWLSIWTWADGQPAAGSNFILNMQYRNSGDAPTENAVITATLEGGLAYLGDTSGLPVSGSGAPGDPLVWQLGAIPPNPNIDKRFYLFTQVTAAAGEWVTNSVQIENGTPYDQDKPEDKYNQWSGQVFDNNTEINIGKGAWTWDPVPGSEFVYNVNICNNGSTDSAEVIVTDTLPLSTTLLSWWGQQPGWQEVSSSAHQLVVSRLSFPGYRCSEIYLRVQLDAGAWTGMPLHNVAEVFASNDLNPGDNWTEIWHNVGFPHANLRVNINWNWGELVPGGEIRYILDYHNDGNLPAEDVRITETLPASTTFVGAYWYDEKSAYPFTPTLVTDEMVVWDIGTLDNGYGLNFEVILHVDPQAPPGLELVNTADITRLADEDRYDDNTSVWTEVLYDHGPNLRVRKTGDWHGGDSYGKKAWYNVIVENVGDMPVEHVTITDTLPISMVLDGDPNTDWSQVENFVRNDAEGWFSFTFSYLHPNWRRDINMNVINPSPDPVPGGQFFTNYAEIMQVEGEPAYDDNTTEFTLVSGPDLYVEKSLLGGEILPGEVVTFSLLFGNDQAKQAWWWNLQGSAWLTDVLPAGTEFITATQRWCGDRLWCPVGADVQGDTLTWQLWPMGGGEWNEFRVTVRLPDTLTGMDTIVNTAHIFSDQPDLDIEPDYTNNTAVYQAAVELPYFMVDKVYDSNRVAGMPVTYTLTVSNTGNSSGSGVAVSDHLPENVAYVSGGSFDAGTGDVTWSLPILASGDAAQVAFVGQLTCQAGLDAVNDAYRVTGSMEGVTSSWGASVSFMVVTPTIQVSFEASSVSVLSGETVYFTGAAVTDGSALAYAWDFGGDGSATGPAASHAFSAPGSYIVTLTVTDGCGYTAEYSLTVEVTASTQRVYLPLVMR